MRRRRDGETRFKLHDRALVLQAVQRASIDVERSNRTRATSACWTARALDALLSMRERNRFLRGMTVWVGFTQTAVPYERDARYAGEHEVHAAQDADASRSTRSRRFSHRPLQLATLIGFLLAALAFVLIPVCRRYCAWRAPTCPASGRSRSWSLLLGGIQLIAIGMIGEYVGRIYDEVKGRPLYLVRTRRNLDE